MASASPIIPISAAALHRLLPSELAKMANIMSKSGVADKILKVFVDYLALLKNPNAVELDDVTRIALQLGSIGIWERVRPAVFVKNIQARVDKRVFAQICDVLNVKSEATAANPMVGHQVPLTPHEQHTLRAIRETHHYAVTSKHLAAALAESHEMSKKQAEAVLGDLVGNIVKHLKKGERIRIGGLGILQVRSRAARMGRNPATGEAIQIKASKKVAFRPLKELKDEVG
jgi:DNA-binding protein HU-beta